MHSTSSPPKNICGLIEKTINVITCLTGHQPIGEQAGVVAAAGAVILVERICERAGFVPSHKSLSELFVIGALLTTKIQDDESPFNRLYAALLGLNLRDMSKKEVRFLKLLGWNAHVAEEKILERIERWRDDGARLKL